MFWSFRDGANPWIYVNRVECMEAFVDVFDESRREFYLDRYRLASGRVK